MERNERHSHVFHLRKPRVELLFPHAPVDAAVHATSIQACITHTSATVGVRETGAPHLDRLQTAVPHPFRKAWSTVTLLHSSEPSGVGKAGLDAMARA
jgi:hypothetical protein